MWIDDQPNRLSTLSMFALVGAVAIVLTCGGCRVFRSHKISDESIAAARQLSLQGIDAQQRGQWDRAETLFAAAILKCPSDERARCGYAESQWHRGAFPEAISHMEEAVRLSGDDPERMVRLGQMYRARGDLTKAAGLADRAISVNGQLAAAWALRGEVLQLQGNRNEALASYHRALSYEQPLPEVQLAIAEIYSQENRPQRALATLQSLASSYAPGPVPPHVLFREALVLRVLARHQDSARVLADAAQQPNPPAELLCELTRSQMLAGDSGAARQTVAFALNAFPQHLGCLALAQELGMPRGAVTTASAISTSPR
jgi:tetratricopeptide (TPR) repeat protein